MPLKQPSLLLDNSAKQLYTAFLLIFCPFNEPPHHHLHQHLSLLALGKKTKTTITEETSKM